MRLITLVIILIRVQRFSRSERSSVDGDPHLEIMILAETRFSISNVWKLSMKCRKLLLIFFLIAFLLPKKDVKMFWMQCQRLNILLKRHLLLEAVVTFFWKPKTLKSKIYSRRKIKTLDLSSKWKIGSGETRRFLGTILWKLSWNFQYQLYFFSKLTFECKCTISSHSYGLIG